LGAVYLFLELKRQNLLGKSLVPVSIGAGLILTLSEGLLFFIAQVSQQPFLAMPWWQFGLIAILCGGLLGVVTVGARASKPFPFGPALAAGAVIAMFYDPFTAMAGGA
jgi:prepilin signal peptidase PulO-like enzyme (type II secretory pathway)